MPLSDKQFWTRAWLCFFGYAVLASLFIQLILLPYIMPAWHAGHGLMKGHDWVTYHAWGVELARFIKMGDWKSWWNADSYWIEVRAISIPYAFIATEPWALIPFNAFFHAATGVLIAITLHSILLGNRKAALLGSLPYVFFPTALLWTSQIHKDGANNFAFACFLFGWILVFSTKKLTWQRLLSALFLITLGTYFSWVLRPYLGAVLTVCSCLFLFVGTIAYSFPKVFEGQRNHSFGLSLLAAAVLVATLHPVVKGSSYSGLSLSMFTPSLIDVTEGEEVPPEIVPAGQEAILVQEAPVMSSSSSSSASPNVPVNNSQKVPVNSKLKRKKQKTIFVDKNSSKAWEKTPFVPDYIENKAYTLANVRTGFIGMNLGKANIDDGYHFYKLSDEILYLPRAIQLAVLAPFPISWFQSNSTEYNNFFKKIVVLEMVLVYLTVPFFLLFLWKNARKKETWVLFLYCFSVLALFGLSVANLGTLCRFRYFFLFTWVGMGVSYAATHVSSWQWIRYPIFKILKAKTA